MRNRSRCRGGTCVELAISIGVIGALIIVLTGIVVRKVEHARGMHGAGAICR